VITTLGSARLVISPHEVFTPFDVSRGGSGIRLAKRTGARLYGRAADLIVCSSPLEMRDTELAGLPGAKLTWIYHPVIDDRASAVASPPRATERRRLRVGYLGRLHPKKNVALLIDAVGQLDGRVSLVIAGGGEATLETALRRQAERLLPGRADFIGWVASGEKARFLSNVDVLAMPSDYECFGVAAIEALAAGTPVIVSDNVGVADIIREHRVGRVVAPTVETFAGAIRGYFIDPRSLSEDATRARAAALADASYTAHGTRLASSYARLLASPS
jgi:glycosyltransferase involved in cell wall biosynthesis